MNKILCCLAAFSSLLAINSHAKDGYPEFGSKPSGRFVVSKNPYFAHPERALKNLMIFEKKSNAINHFFIVGYNWASGHSAVWVHWKEEETLISWSGSTDQQRRENGLTTSRRTLKLGRDTVETDADINGSSYLETRAWWEGVAKDCDAHGEKFTIKPFTVKKKQTEEQGR
jgi:hypothetical protein